MPLIKARRRISDYNKNRKNKAHETHKKVMAVSLSLTSMVDMFAILVIFLLVNQSHVEEWVKVEHDIKLPKAKASDQAKKATTVSLTVDKLFGEDTNLADVASISKGPLIVAPLRKWLSTISGKEGAVTVVSDEKVPFSAVRRVIATCQEAGFKNVNLAVFPK